MAEERITKKTGIKKYQRFTITILLTSLVDDLITGERQEGLLHAVSVCSIEQT